MKPYTKIDLRSGLSLHQTTSIVLRGSKIKNIQSPTQLPKSLPYIKPIFEPFLVYALFIFLVFLAVSCDPPSECIPNSPKPSKEELKQDLANQVRAKTLSQLKQDFGLSPCGISAKMMYEIKMLGISFDYSKDLSIQEARELLVNSGKVFLENINSSEPIRQFLINDPFQPENIDIRIFLEHKKNQIPNRLCVISLVNGILRYKTKNAPYSLQVIHEETFEEAMEIVLTGATPRL